MDIKCGDFFHYVDTKLCPFSSDANSPAFGGRHTLFCLVSRSPALVHKSPAFTSTINIEYLVKNKADLVWDLAPF